ncbi:LysR family transcriptional regulator [Fusobacterium necrogenes]|uniref:LysR family transcriptional regulator n=1 Tax=Fusobacterium necrogenes TaxID=858 RepID=UPI00255C538E|nr:LysR family transcriptional regulator [Fusobacterium necrogenes]
MTLRHLKIFLSLYKTRSTTATSKELLVAQPTISIALKKLEEHYNVKLFDHFSQRLHLTQARKELYHYAKHIINLFDEAENCMKSIEILGNITIGSSITIGNYFLPKYIKKFQEKYPYTKIKVIIDNTNNIEKLLLENKIDIGLVEGKVTSNFLQVSPYMSDKLCVICNPNHPYAQYKKLNPRILINESMIMREKGSAVRELFDMQMENIGLKIEPLWESISSHSIIQAVKENLGISILPYFIVKEYIERNEISTININEINLSRDFNIIYHKSKFHSTHFNNFIKICLNDNSY